MGRCMHSGVEMLSAVERLLEAVAKGLRKRGCSTILSKDVDASFVALAASLASFKLRAITTVFYWEVPDLRYRGQ